MKVSKFILLIVLPLCLALCGCAGKKKEQAKIRRAYAAGEEAAMAQMQQAQSAQGPPGQQPGVPTGSQEIRILGTVKNSVLTWTEGLTLAHAFVEAEYRGQRTPKSITIYRNNQPIYIDPQQLLDGEDYPLFAGDTILIQN